MESTDSTARDTGDLTMLRELNQAYLDSVRLETSSASANCWRTTSRHPRRPARSWTSHSSSSAPAGPRTLDRLEGEDVRIRILGDVAIIHAATTYTSLTGQEGRGRYTDDWQKRNGTWVCVSAHVTRL